MRRRRITAHEMAHLLPRVLGRARCRPRSTASGVASSSSVEPRPPWHQCPRPSKLLGFAFGSIAGHVFSDTNGDGAAMRPTGCGGRVPGLLSIPTAAKSPTTGKPQRRRTATAAAVVRESAVDAIPSGSSHLRRTSTFQPRPGSHGDVAAAINRKPVNCMELAVAQFHQSACSTSRIRRPPTTAGRGSATGESKAARVCSKKETESCWTGPSLCRSRRHLIHSIQSYRSHARPECQSFSRCF